MTPSTNIHCFFVSLTAIQPLLSPHLYPLTPISNFQSLTHTHSPLTHFSDTGPPAPLTSRFHRSALTTFLAGARFDGFYPLLPGYILSLLREFAEAHRFFAHMTLFIELDRLYSFPVVLSGTRFLFRTHVHGC